MTVSCQYIFIGCMYFLVYVNVSISIIFTTVFTPFDTPNAVYIRLVHFHYHTEGIICLKYIFQLNPIGIRYGILSTT